jgi:hypothetical protein
MSLLEAFDGFGSLGFWTTAVGVGLPKCFGFELAAMTGFPSLLQLRHAENSAPSIRTLVSTATFLPQISQIGI